MEQTSHSVSSIEIDTSLIPEGVCDDLCRVVFKGVRDFFSNMTPAQREDFERWKIEYRKRKSLKGGET